MPLLPFVVGYLIGSFPTGVVISRRRFGIDVREIGSGNIGATNITRAFGWSAGVFVFLVDYLKAVLPLVYMQRHFPEDPWMMTAMAVGLVTGHCFSLYLKFKGGKGVATSFGCFSVISPWLAGAAGLVYVVLLVATRISAVGSLGGIAVVLGYAIFFKPPKPTAALIYFVSAVVLIRHQSNIRRLVHDLRGKKAALAIALLICASPSFGAFSENIAESFSVAKKDKKPLLISFYGIWCPPCNELEETVFETALFQKKAEAFRLLKVDADKDTSWKLKDKYKVGGYPTIIFTNPEGGELYRVVGYRDRREFLRIMDLVLNSRGKDLEHACKSKDKEDLYRCALVCSERKDIKCAREAYQKLETTLSKGDVKYLLAETFFVENEDTNDLKRVGYERLMKSYPNHPLALAWASDYSKLFEKGKKPEPKNELIEAVLSHFSEFRKHPDLAEIGIPESDLLQGRAELLGFLGKDEDAKSAWKEASNYLETLAKQSPQAPARGFALERMSCLESAGFPAEALKLAQEYQGRYPDEFTFHFKAASLLYRLKKYGEAIPIAKKAYESSYGDNRIRVATLLIDLYATVPDKESAKRIYQEVTETIHPDSKLDIRTHKYLDKLKQELEKIS